MLVWKKENIWVFFKVTDMIDELEKGVKKEATPSQGLFLKHGEFRGQVPDYIPNYLTELSLM